MAEAEPSNMGVDHGPARGTSNSQDDFLGSLGVRLAQLRSVGHDAVANGELSQATSENLSSVVTPMSYTVSRSHSSFSTRDDESVSEGIEGVGLSDFEPGQEPEDGGPEEANLPPKASQTMQDQDRDPGTGWNQASVQEVRVSRPECSDSGQMAGLSLEDTVTSEKAQTAGDYPETPPAVGELSSLPEVVEGLNVSNEDLSRNIDVPMGGPMVSEERCSEYAGADFPVAGVCAPVVDGDHDGWSLGLPLELGGPEIVSQEVGGDPRLPDIEEKFDMSLPSTVGGTNADDAGPVMGQSQDDGAHPIGQWQDDAAHPIGQSQDDAAHFIGQSQDSTVLPLNDFPSEVAEVEVIQPLPSSTLSAAAADFPVAPVAALADAFAGCDDDFLAVLGQDVSSEAVHPVEGHHGGGIEVPSSMVSAAQTGQWGMPAIQGLPQQMVNGSDCGPLSSVPLSTPAANGPMVNLQETILTGDPGLPHGYLGWNECEGQQGNQSTSWIEQYCSKPLTIEGLSPLSTEVDETESRGTMKSERLQHDQGGEDEMLRTVLGQHGQVAEGESVQQQGQAGLDMASGGSGGGGFVYKTFDDLTGTTSRPSQDEFADFLASVDGDLGGLASPAAAVGSSYVATDLVPAKPEVMGSSQYTNHADGQWQEVFGPQSITDSKPLDYPINKGQEKGNGAEEESAGGYVVATRNPFADADDDTNDLFGGVTGTTAWGTSQGPVAATAYTQVGPSSQAAGPGDWGVAGSTPTAYSSSQGLESSQYSQYSSVVTSSGPPGGTGHGYSMPVKPATSSYYGASHSTEGDNSASFFDDYQPDEGTTSAVGGDTRTLAVASAAQSAVDTTGQYSASHSAPQSNWYASSEPHSQPSYPASSQAMTSLATSNQPQSQYSYQPYSTASYASSQYGAATWNSGNAGAATWGAGAYGAEGAAGHGCSGPSGPASVGAAGYAPPSSQYGYVGGAQGPVSTGTLQAGAQSSQYSAANLYGGYQPTTSSASSFYSQSLTAPTATHWMPTTSSSTAPSAGNMESHGLVDSSQLLPTLSLNSWQSENVPDHAVYGAREATANQRKATNPYAKPSVAPPSSASTSQVVPSYYSQFSANATGAATGRTSLSGTGEPAKSGTGYEIHTQAYGSAAPEGHSIPSSVVPGYGYQGTTSGESYGFGVGQTATEVKASVAAPNYSSFAPVNSNSYTVPQPSYSSYAPVSSSAQTTTSSGYSVAQAALPASYAFMPSTVSSVQSSVPQTMADARDLKTSYEYEQHGAQGVHEQSDMGAYGWAPPGSANLTPQIYASGTKSPHGRPLCSLVTFGFGGRAVVMLAGQSGSSFMSSASTQLHHCTMQQLVTVTQVPGVGVGAASEDTEAKLLQSFPGPLTSGVNRDKVIKYISERESQVGEEERAPEVMRAIWGVLRVWARGPDKSSRATQEEGKGMEAELLKVLMGEGAASSTLLGPVWTGATPHSDLQKCAAHVQQLLLEGKRREALKVATDGHLWGAALMLAYGYGEKVFQETCGAMAQSSFAPGCPLRTLCLLIAGQPQVLSEELSEACTPTPGGLSPTAGAPPGYFWPGPTQLASQGASPLLQHWRENLSIMAANRTANGVSAIMQLGDQLWSLHQQVEAAHLCYLVGGGVLEPYQEDGRLVLLGSDHRQRPRTFASTLALQRSEVYEWIRMHGPDPQPVLALLPFKVVYAARLAEMGMINDALLYCQAVEGVLKNAKVNMAICSQQLAILKERLQTHAAAHNIKVKSSESSLSKLGQFLDSTINRVMGGPVAEEPPKPTAPNMTRNSSWAQFSSATSQDYGAPGAWGVGYSAQGANSYGVPQPYDPAIPPQPTSTGGVNPNYAYWGPGPQTDGGFGGTSEGGMLSSQGPSAPTSAGGAPPTSGASDREPRSQRSSGGGRSPTDELGGRGSKSSKSGSSWFKVGSLKNLLVGKKEAKLGLESEFYYDEKLKKWRVRGKEDEEEDDQPPPPPPTSFGSMSGPTSTAGSQGTPSPTLSRTPSPPPIGSGPPDTQGFTGAAPAIPLVPSATGPGLPPQPANFFSRGKGVRSRYVDTFNTSVSSQASATSVSSLLPPMPQGNSMLLPPAPDTAFRPPQPFMPAPMSPSSVEQGPSEQGHHSRNPSGTSFLSMHSSLSGPPSNSSITSPTPVFHSPSNSLTNFPSFFSVAGSETSYTSATGGDCPALDLLGTTNPPAGPAHEPQETPGPPQEPSKVSPPVVPVTELSLGGAPHDAFGSPTGTFGMHEEEWNNVDL